MPGRLGVSDMGVTPPRVKVSCSLTAALVDARGCRPGDRGRISADLLTTGPRRLRNTYGITLQTVGPLSGSVYPLSGVSDGYRPARGASMLVMVGFEKGIDVQREIRRIREAAARIGAAMQSDPDAANAFRDATALEQLGSEISEGASAFRAWFAAELADERHIPQTRLTGILGLSPGRVGQLVRAGRKRKGNPIVDPGTQPLQPPVVLAVVTGSLGVLICHRRDGRPPWTFPGGDILPGEAPADAAERRVLAETGLAVKTVAVLGSRVHPRTARHMVYLACQPEKEVNTDRTAPEVGADDADLDRAEWAGLDTVRDRMPDMYEPVKAHLEATLGSIERF
jgi:8-oxo-dGTP diphosphatase